MILSELKDYLRENKVVSMHDLIMHFDTDPDAIREMLAVWIQKGKVRQIQDAEAACRKCAQCYLLSAELYEWVE